MANDFVDATKVIEIAEGQVHDGLDVAATFASNSALINSMDTTGETVKIRLRGRLPFRVYSWRNARTEPIVLDEYKETWVPLEAPEHLYSAVGVIQEDLTDLSRVGRVLQAQTDAVTDGINATAATALTGATHPVTLGVAADGSDLRARIFEAKYALDKMRAPAQGRFLLVSAEFELAMLNVEGLVAANWSGDANTSAAFRDAVITRVAGFTVVRSNLVPAGEAYAYARDGFGLVSMVPPALATAKAGTRSSALGIALRWLYDGDLRYYRDISAVDVWAGAKVLEQPLLIQDAETNQYSRTEDVYNISSVKLEVGGTTAYPAAGSDIAKATGIADPNAA